MTSTEPTGTDASVDQIISALMDGSYDATWYPGRTGTEREGTDTPVVSANWNHVPDGDRIQRVLEGHGIEVDWCDEVYACDDCHRAVTTSPQHWCWTPSYAWESAYGECGIVCHACCGSRGLRWTEDGRGFRTVDPEDWRDRSISSGTMRPEDTVPAMVSALRELGYSGGEWRRAHAEFRTIEPTEARLVSAVLNGDNTGDPDDTGESVAWLADLLSEVAPDGCYFGAHPGEGACFGFWEVEEC